MKNLTGEKIFDGITMLKWEYINGCYVAIAKSGPQGIGFECTEPGIMQIIVLAECEDYFDGLR